MLNSPDACRTVGSSSVTNASAAPSENDSSQQKLRRRISLILGIPDATVEMLSRLQEYDSSLYGHYSEIRKICSELRKDTSEKARRKCMSAIRRRLRVCEQLCEKRCFVMGKIAAEVTRRLSLLQGSGANKSDSESEPSEVLSKVVSSKIGTSNDAGKVSDVECRSTKGSVDSLRKRKSDVDTNGTAGDENDDEKRVKVEEENNVSVCDKELQVEEIKAEPSQQMAAVEPQATVIKFVVKRNRSPQLARNTTAVPLVKTVRTRSRRTCSFRDGASTGRSSNNSDAVTDSMVSSSSSRARRKRARKSSASTATNSAVSKQASTLANSVDADGDDTVFCACRQISYGQMILCDYKYCPIRWYHFDCAGIAYSPKGKWYCPECREDTVGKKLKPELAKLLPKRAGRANKTTGARRNALPSGRMLRRSARTASSSVSDVAADKCLTPTSATAKLKTALAAAAN